MKAKTLENAIMGALDAAGKFSPELSAIAGTLWYEAEEGDATARRIVSAIVAKLPHLGPLPWGQK